jgi:hypothetical protein
VGWLLSSAASVFAVAAFASPPPVQRPAGMQPPAAGWMESPAPSDGAIEPAPSEPAPSEAPEAEPGPAPIDAPLAPTVEADPAEPTPADAGPPPRSAARSLDGAPGPAEPASAGALRRTRDKDVRFPHRGAIFEAQIGTMGCVRSLCDDSRHAISPGVRLNGFLGGNIRGWVELGLGGGWGSMRSSVAEGTNALTMYGLDPGLLQQALAAQAAGLIDVDLYGLATSRAKMSSVNVGPVARVHFIPRGRFTAWAGSGVGYHLLRNKYETLVGTVKLDFHGLAVPIEAGLGVFVHEHVAVTAQFDYLWTWYGLAVLDHPDQRAALPVAALQAAANLQNVDLRAQLPQFWTLGFGLRARI